MCGQPVRVADVGPSQDDAELAAAVHAALPGRALVVRPGIVAGPHDPTNRFSAWVARGARGGRMLAPGAPDRPLQLVDARDLAAFVLDLTAAGTTGVYNAVGSPALTWGAMLGACASSGAGAELVWVPDETLAAAGVGEEQLPLWIAANDRDNAGFMRIDGARAVAGGLRNRPITETARDTRAALRPEDGLGLDPALEARLTGA